MDSLRSRTGGDGQTRHDRPRGARGGLARGPRAALLARSPATADRTLSRLAGGHAALSAAVAASARSGAVAAVAVAPGRARGICAGSVRRLLPDLRELALGVDGGLALFLRA